MKIRKLKSGKSVVTLKATTKQKNILLKAALLDSKLTIEDLKYQANGKYNKSFKDLIVGAFLCNALKDFLNSHPNNDKKENKIKK